MSKKSNGKGKQREHRKAGEPLGSMLVTHIVLQAISEHMSEAEFLSAYDAVPRHRRGGPRGIPEKVRVAFEQYQSSSKTAADFDVFVQATGKSEATAERYFGRLSREA